MKEISVGGVPKWIYIVGNLKKRKSGLFKKTKWKRKRKKNGLEQKQKKKKWWKRKKELEVQFEHYCVKLVELMLLKKNCAPLIFRNTLCLIYLFFIVKPLTLVATLQPC